MNWQRFDPRKSYIAIIFGISVIVAPAAAAEERPEDASASAAQTLTLEDLARELIDRSPAVAQKRHAYRSARGRVLSAWLPDDPMFGVDAEGQSDLFRFSGRMNDEYMLSQTIPFPTTLFLRGRQAMRDAQIARQEYEAALRSETRALQQPYYDLFLRQKSILALEEVDRLLEKLTGTVRARYETNRSSQTDLLKANIESSRVDIELFRARQEERVAQAAIARRLNRPFDSRYTLAEAAPNAPLTLSLEALQRQAVEERPELRAAQLMLARARTSRLMAVTSWLPEMTGRLEMRNFRDGRPKEYDTFLGVQIPVWTLLKGAGGEWQAAQADLRAAEAAYDEAASDVRFNVTEAHAKVAAADHAASTYAQFILPQARQQAEIALAGYEAGRTDFLDTIDAGRMLKQAQLEYYQAAAERELAYADLRLAVGGPVGSAAPGEAEGDQR